MATLTCKPDLYFVRSSQRLNFELQADLDEGATYVFRFGRGTTVLFTVTPTITRYSKPASGYADCDMPDVAPGPMRVLLQKSADGLTRIVTECEIVVLERMGG